VFQLKQVPIENHEHETLPQERIGGGDTLPATYILALHLYTIPSNLFRLTNKAMRECDSLSLRPFRVFIWYLWNALNRLTVKPAVVYRGLYNTRASDIIGKALDGKLVFESFTSTSIEMGVACAFMSQTSGCDGVIFKIAARGCREIVGYSYKPLERELLLPPMSRFVIKGVYEATRYNLQVRNQQAVCLATLFVCVIHPNGNFRDEKECLQALCRKWMCAFKALRIDLWNVASFHSLLDRSCVRAISLRLIVCVTS
jgi:hypothetical protein